MISFSCNFFYVGTRENNFREQNINEFNDYLSTKLKEKNYEFLYNMKLEFFLISYIGIIYPTRFTLQNNLFIHFLIEFQNILVSHRFFYF